MSSADGQPAAPLPHKVSWFAPERPVEGNTIYVRPDTASAPAESDDSPQED
jgi:hypothetical protein